MRKIIFFKYFGRIALSIYITSVLVLLNSGCTDRSNQPRTLDDSTIVYQSKSITGSLPKITLSNKISKKTGKPLKPGSRIQITRMRLKYLQAWSWKSQVSMERRAGIYVSY